jgi:hypothetical protein
VTVSVQILTPSIKDRVEEGKDMRGVHLHEETVEEGDQDLEKEDLHHQTSGKVGESQGNHRVL